MAGHALARGLDLGLVEVADPASFSWAGPWIARIRTPDSAQRHAVVMFGVPSGVAFDPSGATDTDGWVPETGYVLCALDIALARPAARPAPTSRGSIEEIWISPTAGAPAQGLAVARALAGRGLDGDRHVTGNGTFPSGLPGSALTLIEAEVCESFAPPLAADEHRRNVVTRGIELNDLVGHDFLLGELRCRGMRLCEPCTVIDGYSERAVLRALVHRGGLRADILEDGELRVGDRVQVR